MYIHSVEPYRTVSVRNATANAQESQLLPLPAVQYNAFNANK